MTGRRARAARGNARSTRAGARDTVGAVTAGRDFDLDGPHLADGGSAAWFVVAVPEDLATLEGHFPDRPVVPGVAQLLLAERAARRTWQDLGAPRTIRRLKFTKALGPGDTLRLGLERDGFDVRFVIARGEVECSRGTIAFREAGGPS